MRWIQVCYAAHSLTYLSRPQLSWVELLIEIESMYLLYRHQANATVEMRIHPTFRLMILNVIWTVRETATQNVGANTERLFIDPEIQVFYPYLSVWPQSFTFFQVSYIVKNSSINTGKFGNCLSFSLLHKITLHSFLEKKTVLSHQFSNQRHKMYICKPIVDKIICKLSQYNCFAQNKSTYVYIFQKMLNCSFINIENSKVNCFWTHSKFYTLLVCFL